MSNDAPERRGMRRMEGVDEHRIVSASVRPGHRVRLIDVSAGGALVETSHRLLPGTSVELQVATGTDRASIYLGLAAGKPCIHISSALPGWAFSCPTCFFGGARST